MKRTFLALTLLGLSLNVYSQLLITSVYDGPLTGGLPKGMELYVTSDIDDLSIYGIGSANNGGGTDGQEFTFPAVSATTGEFIYLASEVVEFTNFFGFAPDYTSFSMSINGDDAIELFKNSVVIDIYGDTNVDGSGQIWEYLDGWAYRNAGTEASAIFRDSDWSYSGRNALDGETSNSSAANPVPLESYATTGGGGGNNDIKEHFISDVQGTPATQGDNSFGDTDVSPLIGEQVIIEGIVVGDFQNNDNDTSRDLNGFYVQEETSDEDGDPASSEGVFVFDQSFGVDVRLGDQVRITGTVDQFFGETQIDNITAVEIIDSNLLDQVTPASISLLDSTAVTISQDGGYQADLEAYEGMLVTISDNLQIVEQFQLDRFNEIKLVAGDRPRQYTQNNAPDAILFDQHQQTLGARRITYDDGLNLQNAGINNLDGFSIYDEVSAKRMGDSITNLSGVMDYKWAGNSSSGATWRIRSHADGSNVFTSSLNGNSPNPRPALLSEVSGTLKVASFNVLNFFTTLDDGNTTTALGHSPRGADDLARFGVDPATAEFDRQRVKLTNAIIALNADILGLIELENDFDSVNDGSTAIEVLVNALNFELGSDVYDYVYPNTQFVGTDAIAVGFIYKPAVVEIADNSAAAFIDDTVAATLDVFSSRDFIADPIFDGPSTNRVSLAVSFTHLDSKDMFTVVANHFKSKGSSGLTDTASPNFDQVDGAGFWNQRRLDGAIAISEWLQTNPTGIDDQDIIILGDLNAYALEEPVQYFLSMGYHNVENTDAYSFVFDGQIGTLDYVLVSDKLFEKFSDASTWHINADEADALDYNLDFDRDVQYFDASSATRNSDHDPLLVGFDFVYTPTTAKDLFKAFKVAVASGEIEGNGRYARFKLYRYKILLYMAARFEQAGKIKQTCRRLLRAEKYSDGKLKPRDLIVGTGLPAFNSLLNKTREDLTCLGM